LLCRSAWLELCHTSSRQLDQAAALVYYLLAFVVESVVLQETQVM